MNITAIGFNKKNDEFYRCTHKNDSDSLILFIFKTTAMFYINGQYQEAYENSFIIIDTDTLFSMYSSGQILKYDWITLHLDKPSEFLVSYNLKTNTVHKLSSHDKTDPFFNILLKEYYDFNTNKHNIIKHCLVSIFSALSEEVKSQSYSSSCPYYQKLLEIRKNIYSMPSEKWTVDTICRKANLSRSYFQLLYREAFGVTCINDVIECKINFARQLLENTSDTVSDISKQCGYDNAVHFMRQFKKNTGLTPSEYRKKNAHICQRQ